MTERTAERWWTVTRGPGAVLATAIHDGNDVRPAIAERMKLRDPDRLREEDPFTGQAVIGVPTTDGHGVVVDEYSHNALPV